MLIITCLIVSIFCGIMSVVMFINGEIGGGISFLAPVVLFIFAMKAQNKKCEEEIKNLPPSEDVIKEIEKSIIKLEILNYKADKKLNPWKYKG